MRYFIFALMTGLIVLPGCGSGDPRATTANAPPSPSTQPANALPPEFGSKEWLALVAKNEAEEEREFRENTLRPGQSKRIGDFEIRFVSAEFRKIETVDAIGQAPEIVGPCLVLTTELLNHSEGRVAVPFAMPYTAEDNFGNELESTFGYDRRAKGDQMMEDTPPGTKATLIVCLNRKIDKARSYKVQMMTSYKRQPGESLRWTAEFDTPLAAN